MGTTMERYTCWGPERWPSRAFLRRSAARANSRAQCDRAVFRKGLDRAESREECGWRRARPQSESPGLRVDARASTHAGPRLAFPQNALEGTWVNSCE